MPTTPYNRMLIGQARVDAILAPSLLARFRGIRACFTDHTPRPSKRMGDGKKNIYVPAKYYRLRCFVKCTVFRAGASCPASLSSGLAFCAVRGREVAE